MSQCLSRRIFYPQSSNYTFNKKTTNTTKYYKTNNSYHPPKSLTNPLNQNSNLYKNPGNYKNPNNYKNLGNYYNNSKVLIPQVGYRRYSSVSITVNVYTTPSAYSRAKKIAQFTFIASHFGKLFNQLFRRTFRSSSLILYSSKKIPSFKTDPKGWMKALPVILWDFLVNTWTGLKLLGLNIRTAFWLGWGYMRGKKWTRREYRLFQSTITDILLMVPFSLFIIIPMAEFLLPFFLTFFPNLLPSTFVSSTEAEDKRIKAHQARVRVAEFFNETTLRLKEYHNPEFTKAFETFIKRIRRGQIVTKEDIYKFITKFRDDITLDNLKRNQIQHLCKFLNIQPIGPTEIMRMRLRLKINQLKKDDKMIQDEGLDNLSIVELKMACAERGMNSMGTREELIPLMEEWLELSLKQRVPTSLLILSRAFRLSSSGELGDVLLTALYYILSHHLPEEVFEEVGKDIELTDNNAEAKLKYLKDEISKVHEEKKEKLQEEEQEKLMKSGSVEDSGLKEEDQQILEKETDSAKLLSAKKPDTKIKYEDKSIKETYDGLRKTLKESKEKKNENDH